jgi:hypothetical protein
MEAIINSLAKLAIKKACERIVLETPNRFKLFRKERRKLAAKIKRYATMKEERIEEIPLEDTELNSLLSSGYMGNGKSGQYLIPPSWQLEKDFETKLNETYQYLFTV